MNELEFKIAKAICQLNRWETPEEIQKNNGGNKLGPGEVILVMNALKAFVPKEKWILVWNNKITAPTPEQGKEE